jgi:hypothetical protein
MKILTLLFAIMLHATFDTSTTAVVSWQQPPGVARTCLRLYHPGEPIPAGVCYDNLEAGEQVVHLPGALPRQWYAPRIGTRIVLAFGMDDVGSAMLGEVPSVYTLYLPLAMQQTARDVPPVYLPAALR